MCVASDNQLIYNRLISMPELSFLSRIEGFTEAIEENKGIPPLKKEWLMGLTLEEKVALVLLMYGISPDDKGFEYLFVAVKEGAKDITSVALMNKHLVKMEQERGIAFEQIVSAMESSIALAWRQAPPVTKRLMFNPNSYSKARRDLVQGEVKEVEQEIGGVTRPTRLGFVLALANFLSVTK